MPSDNPTVAQYQSLSELFASSDPFTVALLTSPDDMHVSSTDDIPGWDAMLVQYDFDRLLAPAEYQRGFPQFTEEERRDMPLYITLFTLAWWTH